MAVSTADRLRQAAEADPAIFQTAVANLQGVLTALSAECQQLEAALGSARSEASLATDQLQVSKGWEASAEREAQHKAARIAEHCLADRDQRLQQAALAASAQAEGAEAATAQLRLQESRVTAGEAQRAEQAQTYAALLSSQAQSLSGVTSECETLKAEKAGLLQQVQQLSQAALAAASQRTAQAAQQQFPRQAEPSQQATGSSSAALTGQPSAAEQHTGGLLAAPSQQLPSRADAAIHFAGESPLRVQCMWCQVCGKSFS